MTTFDSGPLADVALEQVGDRWTLTLARDIRHPPDQVWRLLTDPKVLPEWAPFTADRGLGSTGPVTLSMTDGQARDIPAEVRVADEPRALEYTWGDDLLLWNLAPGRLTLRHTTSGRDAALDVAAGWHLCLAVAERLLDGDPVGPIVGQRAMEFGWPDLRDAYAARLRDRCR